MISNSILELILSYIVEALWELELHAELSAGSICCSRLTLDTHLEIWAVAEDSRERFTEGVNTCKCSVILSCAVKLFPAVNQMEIFLFGEEIHNQITWIELPHVYDK